MAKFHHSLLSSWLTPSITFMMPLTVFLTMLLTMFMGVWFVLQNPTLSFAKSKDSSSFQAWVPGTYFQKGGAEVLVLDYGWRLVWPRSGVLQIQAPDGKILAQADLSQSPQSESRAEAHGLELEESDLGSSGSGGRYLQGKKQPQGRTFRSEQLSSASSPAAQPQVSSRQVQGIKVSTQKFPNGSKILQWDWDQGTDNVQESIFLDRRDTLVWAKQERDVPGGKVILKQFGDGSFSRRLEKGGASFAYTWDIISGSAQLSFNNASGQAVAEFRCDTRGVCE